MIFDKTDWYLNPEYREDIYDLPVKRIYRIENFDSTTFLVSDMEPDSKLLDILVCPKCKGDLNLTDEKDGLICDACKLNYPIRDGIPVMLIEEAQKINN